MNVRRRALATTMLTGLAAWSHGITASGAADLYPKYPGVVVPQAFQPAVDGINWKAGGLGGSLANRSLYGGFGSYSVPLGDRYGLQIDGMTGGFDGRWFGAAAAHLFWRDPNRGLLGLYASGTRWNTFGGLNVGHFAGEIEIYYGRWTLQGIAGVETGNSKSETIGNLIETYNVETRFFDKINLAYYLTDDWKAFAGHRYVGGRNALALGSEFAFRLTGPIMGAVFVEGRIGEDEYRGIWGGLRFYGAQKDKTLIQRHRQDDPIEWNPETLFSITNNRNTTTVPSNNKSNAPPCPEFPFCEGFNR
jgi:hypothetical protein